MSFKSAGLSPVQITAYKISVFPSKEAEQWGVGGVQGALFL